MRGAAAYGIQRQKLTLKRQLSWRRQQQQQQHSFGLELHANACVVQLLTLFSGKS
jgi:hypothetical protein